MGQNNSTVFNDKKDKINSGISRGPIVASVGALGTKTTGSTIESQKSITLKKEDDLTPRFMGKGSTSGGKKSGNTSTRSRKLGGLLNSRLGTSNWGEMCIQ